MDSKKNKVIISFFLEVCLLYFKYFKRVGKKKGGRTRKRKEDRTQLFKSLQFKIGIEQDEFDTQYEDFMKICPKVNIFKNEEELNMIF